MAHYGTVESASLSSDQAPGYSSLELLTGLAAASGPKRGLFLVEWVRKLTSKKKTPQRGITVSHRRAEYRDNEWSVYIPAVGLRTVSGLSPADGLKYTSQRAEVAITKPQGETGLSGATAHFPNLKSRYSEPQATRKERKFRETSLFFKFNSGVSLIEAHKIGESRHGLRLDLQVS